MADIDYLDIAISLCEPEAVKEDEASFKGKKVISLLFYNIHRKYRLLISTGMILKKTIDLGACVKNRDPAFFCRICSIPQPIRARIQLWKVRIIKTNSFNK